MICLTLMLNLRRGCVRRPNGPDRLVLTSPLPSEFFENHRCPLIPAAVEVKAAEVDLGEAVKDLEEDVVVEEQG